jgi:hypothetical protein
VTAAILPFRRRLRLGLGVDMTPDPLDELMGEVAVPAGAVGPSGADDDQLAHSGSLADPRGLTGLRRPTPGLSRPLPDDAGDQGATVPPGCGCARCDAWRAVKGEILRRVD